MSTNPNSEELLAEIQAAIEVNSIGGTDTHPVVTADGLVGDVVNIIERHCDGRVADSRANQAVVTEEMRSEALRQLQLRDERDQRVHDIIEDLREIVRQMPSASRPDGLMQKAQDAVYGMRGRLRLMDDAVLTAALSRAEGQEPVHELEARANQLRQRIQELRIDHPEAAERRRDELAAVEADIATRRSALVKAPAPVVPDGWKLVPVELTQAMEDAHFQAHAEAETVFADVREIWAAMLAASPSQPQAKGEGE